MTSRRLSRPTRAVTKPKQTKRLKRARVASRASRVAKPMRFELAPTAAVDALAPYVDRILRALAAICDEPHYADALVTDESYFSDFSLEPQHYARLSAMLGIAIDPSPTSDDRFIYRVAAKLRQRGVA